MGRLSVSLEENQEEWVEQQKEELGVSKGKIIRECIDEVRRGNSLFADSSTDSTEHSPGKIAALEERLASLENTLQEVTTDEAGADSTPSTPTQSVSAPTSEGVEPSPEREPPEGPPLADHQDAEVDSVAVSGTKEGTTTSQQETDPESVQNGGSSTSEPSSPEEKSGPNPPADSVQDTNIENEERSMTTVSGERLPENSEATAQEQDQESESAITITADITDGDAIEAELKEALNNDTRAEVVLGVWNQLHERGTLHVNSIKNLYEEVPLEYDNEETWWQEGIRQPLEALPGVEPPQAGGNLYRFKY